MIYVYDLICIGDNLYYFYKKKEIKNLLEN